MFMLQHHYSILTKGQQLTLRCAQQDYFVYLLHFEKPIGNPNVRHGTAQHYIGVTARLESRLETHRSGNGAAIMTAVSKAGLRFEVARLWKADSLEAGYLLERRLKSRKEGPTLCPICQHKPLDPLALLMAGHYPFHVFEKPGKRQPMGGQQHD